MPSDLSERIDGWVADFCEGSRPRRPVAAVAEQAQAVLTTLLSAACAHRGRALDELEADDLRNALLLSVARLDLPERAREAVPALCRDFLAELEEQGRLADGRDLGLMLAAQRSAFETAASGRAEPIRRPGSKLGRNDPCPCGSGKKYKRCCMVG